MEEVNALGTHFDAGNFPRHTPGFADMLPGFLDRDAIGRDEQWRSGKEQQNDRRARA
jgi:hypothetical protein